MSVDEYTNSDFEALIEIGEMVYDQAKSLFTKMGYEDDFCIQAVGSARVVFGGSNRMIWNAMSGLHVDRDYCSFGFARKALIMGMDVI